MSSILHIIKQEPQLIMTNQKIKDICLQTKIDPSDNEFVGKALVNSLSIIIDYNYETLIDSIDLIKNFLQSNIKSNSNYESLLFIIHVN